MMLSHGQTVHFRPHSIMHIRKAEHLRNTKIRLKVDFRDPMKRQNFGDTPVQTCIPYLIPCLRRNLVQTMAMLTHTLNLNTLNLNLDMKANHQNMRILESLEM